MREPRSGTLAKSESLLWLLLRTPALLSLVATAFVLLAQYWWFFDLFANFRIQLFAFQLLLLFAFLVIRRQIWAIALGAACILNGIAVRDYILPTGAYTADDRPPAEIRVLTAQQRMSGYVVAGLPIFLVVILSVISPTFLEPMFGEPYLFGIPVGVIILGMGGVMMLIGFMAIRRIVDIEV